MIDQDDMRLRIKKRFDDLGLPLTGKWLLGHGIGQTTVRNFVDGTTQSMTVDTVAKLAGPLKTSERWIIFGADEGISEPDFREMAENAAEEIQAGMRIEEIRSTVASALRDQLKLHLAAGGGQSSEDEQIAPDTDALPPAPTKGGGRARPRTA